MRVLDLWSYCSMGLFDGGCLLELDSVDFFEPFLCPFLGRATKFPRMNERELFAGDFTRSLR